MPIGSGQLSSTSDLTFKLMLSSWFDHDEGHDHHDGPPHKVPDDRSTRGGPSGRHGLWGPRGPPPPGRSRPPHPGEGKRPGGPHHAPQHPPPPGLSRVEAKIDVGAITLLL